MSDREGRVSPSGQEPLDSKPMERPAGGVVVAPDAMKSPSRRPGSFVDSVWRLPMLLFGILFLVLGLAMYLIGVLMGLPRLLFGLNELLLPVNEWIVGNFPVNGSQVTMAVLLPAIMLPVLLHDAIRSLDTALFRDRANRAGWRRGATIGGCIVCAALLVSQTRLAAKAYAARVPLDLPGASLIHVNVRDRDNYRWLVSELSRCGSFFTLPGLYSLYFWTGQLTPTALNNNDLLAFLTDAQQERVIADLSARSGLCVLLVPDLLRFFDRGQLAKNPPLLRYEAQNFVPSVERGQYQLLRRKTP